MADDGLLWLTYEEAAARLAVKKASVQRMARAKKWPRRTGNDGKARIGLPPDRLAENAAAPPPPDHSGRIIAAEARAEELTKQVSDHRSHRHHRAGPTHSVRPSVQALIALHLE